MMYGLPLALGLMGAAEAAPVGSPISDPDAGRVQIGTRVGTGVQKETDSRCNSGDCDATWRTQDVSGVLRLAILRGLGIYGELGWRNDGITEANYNGRARAKVGGVRLAVPITSSMWLAADGRFSFSDGTVRAKDNVESPAISREQIHTATLLGAVGQPSDGGHFWFGAQGAWKWNHQLWPLGDSNGDVSIEVPLTPTIPVTGVVGAELTSDPLGLPWRTETRLTIGVEGRVGQETGLSVLFGVSI